MARRISRVKFYSAKATAICEFLFNHVFVTEDLDRILENEKMPYIVFRKRRVRFEKSFPFSHIARIVVPCKERLTSMASIDLIMFGVMKKGFLLSGWLSAVT